VRFDAEERRVVLELDDEALAWELHPSRGWLRRIPIDDPAVEGGTGAGTGPDDGEPEPARTAAEGWGGRRIRTQRRPRVRAVRAPLDERILELEIDARPGRASRFVFELMTNQWNALALDPAGTIVAALWSREAGGRRLQTGVLYEAPGGPPRAGTEEPVAADRFLAVLGDTPPDARARTLVRELAWTSSLNAAAVLGGAADRNPDGLEAAYDRYRALAARPEPAPRVLDLRDGQPYPLPLPGVDGRTVLSLLDAFAATAEQETPGLAPEVRDRLIAHRDRLRRKADALEREAEAAPGKGIRLRRTADLLMARLHEVPRGARQVELEDFEGGTETVELDPALSPAENAEKLYDRARKRDRAAERLPARVRAVRSEEAELSRLVAALDEGAPDPDALARWIDRIRPGDRDADERGERLPYRSYESSGGLEIRVGRSGRANDELTFHHSSPHDIWLHARDVAGAHVILRWPDRTQNPPRRDLLEAAVLAALSSKARTSSAVPVDWTRRKYVRSPRKAPPGVVLPDRVSTVFVEPDPAVEERLRREP
jgi:predicted ribosome quality control (RQC) complex YloA/Tae2 family protein